jgi:glutathione S-transferase
MRHQGVLDDTLTLADLALSAPLTVTVPAKLPLSCYPNIQSWLGRMQNLDAWKKATA